MVTCVPQNFLFTDEFNQMVLHCDINQRLVKCYVKKLEKHIFNGKVKLFLYYYSFIIIIMEICKAHVSS